MSDIETRLQRMEATLASLATKHEVTQLGYDLTWRFLTVFFSVMGVVLIGYLGAVWFVISQTLKAHGVS